MRSWDAVYLETKKIDMTRRFVHGPGHVVGRVDDHGDAYRLAEPRVIIGVSIHSAHATRGKRRVEEQVPRR